MAIFELFSKRQKRLRGEMPDIFQYEDLPNKLRTQIIFIIKDGLGTARTADHYETEKIYQSIHDIIAREYGVPDLGTNENYRSINTYEAALFSFLMKSKNHEEVLDIVQECFRCMDLILRNESAYYLTSSLKLKVSADEAILELNERFKENGVGYAYIDGQIIRIDSTFTHAEITKPTLTLLSSSTFHNANDEYLKAHEHYLHGRNMESINESLKAFESVMKLICAKKGWPFDPKSTASQLIKICFENKLIPPFMETQFNAVRTLLESGVPTIRNKVSGHGQGEVRKEADSQLVRYALNLTGSNIIYLIEQSGLQ